MVVQVIPLIAGLRDENKNLSDVYFAEGLSSEGDSGSGHYYWNETSTLADDGFNVLQVTGVTTGRWIRIYAGYNIYSADGSLAGDRTVTLNGHYLAFAGASYSSTFNADGSVTLGSLIGSGTRMVVAGPSGVIGTQAIAPGTGTTTRFIETFTATAGQTTFITANTLLNDFFDVFVNGVRLDSLSYTNTSNQVVLTDGCLVGDIVDIVGFSSLGVATVLPSQSGNAGKYLRTDGANVYWDTVSSANNIYNANGTLTGNRVMTMAGYTLSFNGGNVSIGNTAPLSALHVGDRNVNNSTNPVILISRNVTSSFASNTHAFSDSSLLQLATGLAYNSYDARVDIGGSNSIDHYAGFQHGINVNTSGTIMNIYGLFTNTTITAGAIENNYSVYAYNPTGAGTITNNFGLYVANLSKGSNNYGVYLDISSGSGKWNIYSNGTADSYINGNVGIGAVPGAYKLDVTGTFRTSGVNTLSNLSGTGTRMVVADATGILSTQSVPSLTGYVPYTGATQNVDLGVYKLTTDAVQFSLTPTNSPAAGQIAYYGATGALAYLMDATSVMCQIGQQLYAYVTNDETITILKGQPVYLFSATGNRASVKLAANTSDATSAKTLGLAAQDITAGQKGFIMCQGTLDGLDTGSYLSGATLYLGATAGTLTTTKPYAPNHLVYIGVVERSNAGNGQIYVRPQNGYELDEIHDVDLISTPPVNNDILTYVTGTNNLWKPRSIASILGYTPANAATTLTINGTTYDISANRTWSVGTVTSVAALTIGTTGTDVSSTVANGTTTPVITLNIPTASATNRGALSSTDWSTFNSKQGALTLTTTGTSGAATLVGNTLNIPQYSGGGGGMAIGGSITSATAGSVLYVGGGSVLAENNANFFWNNTLATLLIGPYSSNSGERLQVTGNAKINGANLNLISSSDFIVNYTTVTDGLVFQPNNSNTESFIVLKPTGTATNSAIFLSSSPTISGNQILAFGGGFSGQPTGTWAFGSTVYGNPTGTARPISFVVGSSAGRTEIMRISATTVTLYKDLTTNLTSGSVPFIGTSGVLAQDNSNLFWDNTNKKLAIGTSTPSASAARLTVSYSDNNYNQGVVIQNTNTGTTAITGMLLQAQSNLVGAFSFYPSNYTTTSNQNTVVFSSVGPYKLGFQACAVGAGGSAQDIWFSTFVGNGSNYQMIIKANGNLLINSTTDSGERLQVTGSIKSTSSITSSVSGSTVSFIAYNPSASFPRANFEIGNSASDTNIGLQIAASSSSSTLQKQAFIIVSTNKDALNASSYQLNFGVSTTIAEIITTNRSGSIGAGAGIPIAFSPSGVEAMRLTATSGNLLIGTNTDVSSSILTLSSTTKGFLPPKMTTTQKNAIASPVAGLVVYDTTLNKLCVYTTAWETITSI